MLQGGAVKKTRRKGIFGQPHKQNWAADGPWCHLRGNGGNMHFTNDCCRSVEDDVFVYIASNNGAL